MKPLNIGLAGMGTVGQGVWKHLNGQAALLRQRCGRGLAIGQISARNPGKLASLNLPDGLVTPDWRDLLANPELDVIVELIGGTTDAYALIRGALEAGKHVVTANKALLAAHGAELFQLAATQKRRLLYEASVAGGIPLLQSLREGLVANRIVALYGIINGTCNYILTQMSELGLDYAEVLAEAKRLGYAEADESLDVDGHDTAHKAVVLAALAYGFWPRLESVPTRGIAQLERQDILFAQNLGYEIKLLAIVKAAQGGQGRVEVQVQPTLVPSSHVLASIKGVFNAVLVRGDVVGDTLFYGRGAGADATASAVLSDLASLAREGDSASGSGLPCGLWNSGESALQHLAAADEIVARYYLRLNVEDRPGVLAQVATILARRNIGISSVIQPEGHEGEAVPLILMIHDANTHDFQEARLELERLPVVRGPAVSLRVEDFS